MKIQTITHRSRRDFTAIYECESCRVTVTGNGYDDANFHENVIPGWACAACGVASNKQTSTATIPAGLVL
jgi:ribosomal protein L37AE/L43A